MARPDKILRSLLRERFMVTLKSGETFDGLLDRLDESLVELVDVAAVTATQHNSARVPVDGRLYLQRGDIAYLQRVAAP